MAMLRARETERRFQSVILKTLAVKRRGKSHTRIKEHRASSNTEIRTTPLYEKSRNI